MTVQKMTFPIKETICNRKSVRSYDGTELSAEEEKKIDEYIALLAQEENPFHVKVNIQRLKAGVGTNAERLGTYGVIKGTRAFLGVTVENTDLAMEAVGFVVEKLVLYLAHIGIGTCWMAGTFDRSSFENVFDIKENELFPIISPIGHSAEKRRVFDTVFRKAGGFDSRKDWAELFFDQDFQTPLTKENAGAYAYPLEMVRLAPSAVNGQPWRIVRQDGAFHFYKVGSKMQVDKRYDIKRIDMGIAASHFALAAMDKAIHGKIEILNDICVANSENMDYLFSWVEGD